MAADTIYNRLLEFLCELEQKHIYNTLEHARAQAIMVVVDVPGSKWEIEFMDDGSVEVEQFETKGGIRGEEALADLWAFIGEEDA